MRGCGTLVAVAVMALMWSVHPCGAQTQVHQLGIFGVGRGETARLNVVNPDPNTVCGVVLRFVEPDGDLAKEMQATLGPNDTTSLEIVRGKSTSLPLRQRYRAVVRETEGSSCRTTLEIFDNKSGVSRVLVGSFD
jgi:hypothetical protein